MSSAEQQNFRVLRLNISGTPVEWLTWQSAACLYARALVAWTPGSVILRLRGGYNRQTVQRTYLPIHSIIACKGQINNKSQGHPPPLTNRSLFHRDNHRCLYCGNVFASFALTRDHVTPKSKGGKDTWVNCVTSCKRCNHHKGGRTPEEAGMQLTALPYRPNNAEYLALINSRRMLGEQMNFLRTQFSAHNRIPISASLSSYAPR